MPAFVLAAALAWAQAGALSAQGAPAGGTRPPPTCAVLTDAAGAEPGEREAIVARAALLEARLAEGRHVTPVDRAELDRVLREQQLAAAFGPDAGGRRVELGRLLKADLLVFLRPAPRGAVPPGVRPRDRDTSDAALELAVCETATGLRLSTGPAPLSDDAEADARSLVTAIVSAAARYHDRVRVICAVPPFVSDDLGYRFQHLQAVYAMLVEQALLRQPGVLVVELAEARAIARELAVGGQARLARPAPLIVLGRYRHETPGPEAGHAAEPPVAVKLQVLRGEATVAETSGKQLDPAGAAAFLRTSVERFVEDAGAPAAAAGDGSGAPEVEAAQLLARAELFRRLGHPEEEVSLREAALLLEPADRENRRRAAIAYGRLTRLQLFGGTRTAPRVSRALAAYERGLTHLERCFSDTGDLGEHELPPEGMGNFVSDFAYHWEWIHVPVPEELEAMAVARRRNLEVFPPLARRRAAGGWGDERRFVRAAIGHGTVEERMPLVWQAIESMADLPGAEQRAYELATHNYEIDVLKNEAGEALLTKLESSERPEFRKAAARLRKDMAAPRADRFPLLKKIKPEPRGDDDPSPEVVFRPLKLDVARGMPPGSERNFQVGVMPIGDSIDLIWGPGAFLMKEKGKLRKVWPLPGRAHEWVGKPCFDGRYVWLPCTRGRSGPALVVLDPVSQETWQVLPNHGLPTAGEEGPPGAGPARLLVSEFAPGRVCVAGHFGHTWLATVDFEPGREPVVKVFHEAKEVPDRESQTQWKDPGVAFPPAYMFTIRGRNGEAADDVRVVVARGSGGGGGLEASTYPLVIDPATLTVRVSADPCFADLNGNLPHGVALRDGAAYWVEAAVLDPAGGPDAPVEATLWRFGLPGPARTIAALRTYAVIKGAWGLQGKVVLHGGATHVVHRRWWACPEGDESFRMLSGPIPERRDMARVFRDGISLDDMPSPETETIHAIYNSNHYGLVALTTQQRVGYLLYQVQFPPQAE